MLFLAHTLSLFPSQVRAGEMEAQQAHATQQQEAE